jgi:hypothetical protein
MFQINDDSQVCIFRRRVFQKSRRLCTVTERSATHSQINLTQRSSDVTHAGRDLPQDSTDTQRYHTFIHTYALSLVCVCVCVCVCARARALYTYNLEGYASDTQRLRNLRNLSPLPDNV